MTRSNHKTITLAAAAATALIVVAGLILSASVAGKGRSKSSSMRSFLVGSKLESSSRLSDDLFNTNGTRMRNRLLVIPPKLRKQYEQDGFVVIPKVIPQEATTELMSQLESQDLFVTPEYNIFRRLFSSISKTIMTPSTSFQPIADVLYKSDIAPVAKQLVGDGDAKELYHLFDALYMKSVGEAGGSWHRDYPISRIVQNLDEMISLWIPLTSTKGGQAGGSMIMAKGSHKWSFEEGCTGLDHIGGEIVHKKWKGYDTCMERLENVAVALPPMDPGDAVLFHPALFHRTAASYGLSNLEEEEETDGISENDTTKDTKQRPRVALSLVAVTEKARYQGDQSKYECNVKPRLAFALEKKTDGMVINDGDLQLMSSSEHLLPKLVPNNAMLAPKIIESYVADPTILQSSIINMLGNVLLGCTIKKQLGIIPNSYEGGDEEEARSKQMIALE